MSGHKFSYNNSRRLTSNNKSQDEHRLHSQTPSANNFSRYSPIWKTSPGAEVFALRGNDSMSSISQDENSIDSKYKSRYKPNKYLSKRLSDTSVTGITFTIYDNEDNKERIINHDYLASHVKDAKLYLPKICLSDNESSTNNKRSSKKKSNQKIEQNNGKNSSQKVFVYSPSSSITEKKKPVVQCKIDKNLLQITEDLYIGSLSSLRNEKNLCNRNIEFFIDFTHLPPDLLKKQSHFGFIPCNCNLTPRNSNESFDKKSHSKCTMAIDLTSTEHLSKFYFDNGSVPLHNEIIYDKLIYEPVDMDKRKNSNNKHGSNTTDLFVASDYKSSPPAFTYSDIYQELVSMFESINDFIGKAKKQDKSVLIYLVNNPKTGESTNLYEQRLYGETLTSKYRDINRISSIILDATIIQYLMLGERLKQEEAIDKYLRKKQSSCQTNNDTTSNNNNNNKNNNIDNGINPTTNFKSKCSRSLSRSTTTTSTTTSSINCTVVIDQMLQKYLSSIEMQMLRR